jgi:hypothetical protein
MWHRFHSWVAYTLHSWLWGHLQAAVVQIITATVLELGNITLFDWFVYPVLGWTTAMDAVNTIYLADLGLTAFYFLLAGITYVLNRLS